MESYDSCLIKDDRNCINCWSVLLYYYTWIGYTHNLFICGNPPPPPSPYALPGTPEARSYTSELTLHSLVRTKLLESRRSASTFGRRTDHGDQVIPMRQTMRRTVGTSLRSVSANVVLFRKTTALLQAVSDRRQDLSPISLLSCLRSEVKWWMLHSFPVRQSVCISAIYRTLLLLLRDWNRRTVNSRRPWTQSRHQRHPLCWFRG